MGFTWRIHHIYWSIVNLQTLITYIVNLSKKLHIIFYVGIQNLSVASWKSHVPSLFLDLHLLLVLSCRLLPKASLSDLLLAKRISVSRWCWTLFCSRCDLSPVESIQASSPSCSSVQRFDFWAFTSPWQSDSFQQPIDSSSLWSSPGTTRNISHPQFFFFLSFSIQLESMGPPQHFAVWKK